MKEKSVRVALRFENPALMENIDFYGVNVCKGLPVGKSLFLLRLLVVFISVCVFEGFVRVNVLTQNAVGCLSRQFHSDCPRPCALPRHMADWQQSSNGCAEK